MSKRLGKTCYWVIQRNSTFQKHTETNTHFTHELISFTLQIKCVSIHTSTTTNVRLHHRPPRGKTEHLSFHRELISASPVQVPTDCIRTDPTIHNNYFNNVSLTFHFLFFGNSPFDILFGRLSFVAHDQENEFIFPSEGVGRVNVGI